METIQIIIENTLTNANILISNYVYKPNSKKKNVN